MNLYRPPSGTSRLTLLLLVLIGAVLAGGTSAGAIILDIAFLQTLHEARAEHVDQQELFDLVVAGHHEEAFEEAFELGDELFETTFNAIDGVGAR